MNTRASNGLHDAPASVPAAWTDSSFASLLREHPTLQGLLRYLPADPATPVFEGQRTLDALQSSYKCRGYGHIFYALVRLLKPTRCVEIGLLQGFSLLTVASALRDNAAGTIHGFDLFDAYPYRHADERQVSAQIEASGLGRWVDLQTADVFQVHRQFDSVDYLHVDVSNTGDTYRRIFKQWSDKVTQVMLFEGGSADRDEVAWMRQYDKPPIVPALDDLQRSYHGWTISVLQPFPSLTVALNRTALAVPDRS